MESFPEEVLEMRNAMYFCQRYNQITGANITHKDYYSFGFLELQRILLAIDSSAENIKL